MKCEEKIPFWFEDHAKEAMKRAHKRGQIQVRYYLCPDCNNFHLTSKKLTSDGRWY